MNEVNYTVALEIASHESVVRSTYRDSKGINTWSVGLTNATGHRVERYINNPQTLQHCLDVYVWALKNYAIKVQQTFDGYDLTEAQFTAALSFHWNTGAIATATWVKKWKAGDISGARKSFMDWRKPPEIIKRRKKERDLFFNGKWSNDGTMTEYTRLTKRRTPIWRSARKINVEAELAEAFKNNTSVDIDTTPNPDSVPLEPTLSAPPGLWRQIITLLYLLLNWLKRKETP